jgi:hypothetical protein
LKFKKISMKKLLFLIKPSPGETPKSFADRITKNLKDRKLMNEQGKLVMPIEPKKNTKQQQRPSLEVASSWAAMSPAQRQEWFMKGSFVKDATMPGTATQITGYPQPPKQKQEKKA